MNDANQTHATLMNPNSSLDNIESSGSENVTLRMAAETPATGADTGPTYVERLIRELDSFDPRARCRAVFALENSDHPLALPALVNCLFDADEAVRRAAAAALLHLPWINPTGRELAQQAIIFRNWDTVVSLGQDAVDSLLQALENYDPLTRKGAAECLGKIGDPRAVPPLIATLEAKDFGVRRAAADALGQMRDPRALTALQMATGDPFKIVRDAAEKAIRSISGIE